MIMNLTLPTEENATVDLDAPALLPGQSAAGIEIIKNEDLEKPVILRAKARANNPMGRIAVGGNTTSISLKSKGASP